MNEKLMKIEVFVDTSSKEQVDALHEFLTVVGNTPAQTDLNAPQTTQAPEAEAKPRRGRKPQAPAQEAPAPKAEDEAPASPAPEEDPEVPGVAKEYSIEEVREKLKEKVGEHREEIKAKLTELGAPNVSNLDPAKYTEFVEFLEGLDS